MSSPEFHVGVVGATGVVGEKIVDLLIDRKFPAATIRPFASPRSAGEILHRDGFEAEVEDLTKADLSGLDVVLMSAGGRVSGEYAPQFVEAGAVVIDNSSYWRKDPDVPLVVPEVNSDALKKIRKGIVANPNCTTIAEVVAVNPLHQALGLTALTVTSIQAVSGAGKRGIDELAAQQGGSEHIEVFARRVAENVFPMRGVGTVDGFTDEELKMRDESRKILGLPDLEVRPTCYSLGVQNGHSLSIYARFSNPVSRYDAEAILEVAPGVEVCQIPEPISATGKYEIEVGRVREADKDGRGLLLTVAGDNVLKGAALNAVQIAEEMVVRRILA